MTRIEVKNTQAKMFGDEATLPEICQRIMSRLRRASGYDPLIPIVVTKWLSFLNGVLETWQASDDLYDRLVADMVSCVAERLREAAGVARIGHEVQPDA